MYKAKLQEIDQRKIIKSKCKMQKIAIECTNMCTRDNIPSPDAIKERA